MSNLTLTALEIEEITGYTQPCKQLESLRKQGFIRARRVRDGAVIVEREHYLAVCNGQFNNVRSIAPSANTNWMNKKTA